ncbi:MAG: GNAT family N-acetyltransferase [Anaerobacillus sp.]
MKLRKYDQRDLHQIIDLFYDTVHSINRGDYSISQVNAWANPDDKDYRYSKWGSALNQNFSYVAEKEKEIVGFIDMTSAGFLDHLYVHRNYQREKIASELLEIIETIARDQKLTVITTEASITARPFFEKRNFQVTASQIVKTNGVLMNNYVMMKRL